MTQPLLTEKHRQQFVDTIQNDIKELVKRIIPDGENSSVKEVIASYMNILKEIKKLSIEDYSNEEHIWVESYKKLNKKILINLISEVNVKMGKFGFDPIKIPELS